MTAPCKVKNIVDDGKILLVNTAQAVVNSVEELSEHLDCPKNIKFVNPEDLVSFPHAHSKFLLVPVKLMALGKVQKCLMQEDNEYRREFLGTIDFRKTSYFVYKPASVNEKHSSAKRIMDRFFNMSIGRIVALLLSYSVICFRQGESAQKSAELGWKKGVSGGSEVTGIQINSARVAEFLYMR